MLMSDMIAGYYGWPVTTALSEGISNVIKLRAYGYRNTDYLKLKIMQVCGLLNSNYLKARGNHESMAETNMQQGPYFSNLSQISGVKGRPVFNLIILLEKFSVENYLLKNVPVLPIPDQ